MLVVNLLLLLLSLCSSLTFAIDAFQEEAVRGFFSAAQQPNTNASTHANNWAVLVCSSRYWFNYRASPYSVRTFAWKSSDFSLAHG